MMNYRNKAYNKLMAKYMTPILRFIGLTIDRSNEMSMLAWVGDNEDEVFDYSKHKLLKPGKPNWFVNDKRDPVRVYTFIESEDEYLKYKKNHEKLEYFNPLLKWNNTQFLLMLMIPGIFERYCKTEDVDDDDYINALIYDRVVVTQEELLKYINIKYFPIEIDEETGEKVYHYEIDLKRDNGENNIIISKSTNRSVCILMVILKILSLIDDIFDMDDMPEIQQELETLINSYTREYELNMRDLREVHIDKSIELDVGVESEEKPDLFETYDVEDLINTSSDVSDSNEMAGDIQENKSEDKPVDITDMYRNDLTGLFDLPNEFDGIELDLY